MGTQTETTWGPKAPADVDLQRSLGAPGAGTADLAARDPGAEAPLARVPARAAAWYALWVLFAINLLNFFDRQILGSLAEQVRKEFQLNDTSLGLLATVFTLMYAVVGLPLGRMSDRWYRTRLIALGTAVWSIFTATSKLGTPYRATHCSRLKPSLYSVTKYGDLPL